MYKKENGLPRAIKALAMTNKGTFTYPTKFREEGEKTMDVLIKSSSTFISTGSVMGFTRNR